MNSLQTGALVEHPVWGRGKVLDLRPPNVQAFFLSLIGTPDGPVRIVRSDRLVPSDAESDPVLDRVTGDRLRRILNAKGAGRTRVLVEATLEQAIAWFERKYPGRFADSTLHKDEIGYKQDAHRLFVSTLAGELGRGLLAEQAHEQIAKHLHEVYHGTNIPSRFEVMAASDGLKDAPSAARLLEAVLDFLDAASGDTFARLVDAVGSLPAPASGSPVLTWPNVTILPFLADPSRFIVTKPEITKQAAARLGAELLYSPSITWDTYQRVLFVAERLLERLRPLGARDFIDVQSFMWVTRQLV